MDALFNRLDFARFISRTFGFWAFERVWFMEPVALLDQTPSSWAFLPVALPRRRPTFGAAASSERQPQNISLRGEALR